MMLYTENVICRLGFYKSIYISIYVNYKIKYSQSGTYESPKVVKEHEM